MIFKYYKTLESFPSAFHMFLSPFVWLEFCQGSLLCRSGLHQLLNRPRQLAVKHSPVLWPSLWLLNENEPVDRQQERLDVASAWHLIDFSLWPKDTQVCERMYVLCECVSVYQTNL